MIETPVPMAAPPAQPLDEGTLRHYRSMSGEEARQEWHSVMEGALRSGEMDPSVPERLRALIEVCHRHGVGILPR